MFFFQEKSKNLFKLRFRGSTLGFFLSSFPLLKERQTYNRTAKGSRKTLSTSKFENGIYLSDFSAKQNFYLLIQFFFQLD